MTESTAPAPSALEAESPEERRSHVIELWLVILLGVVSVATAYASFQAALYGGQQAAAYAVSQNAQTEAESLYLEANQQYQQDAATLARLAELSIQAESSDPAAAAVAAESLEQIYFMNVSEDLDGAIERAAAVNDADPSTYTSPLDDEEYQAALFGAWAEKDEEAKAAAVQGNQANNYGDRLTLSATLMAITLFLLGVAAVVRRERTKVLLMGIGMVVFVGSAAIAVMVPFTWL